MIILYLRCRDLSIFDILNFNNLLIVQYYVIIYNIVKEVRKLKNKLKRICAMLIVCVTVLSVNTTSAKAATYEEKIYTYLVNVLGFNNAAACGVLANIYYESEFNPDTLGDYGTSFGLCQWHGVRFERLKSFCAKQGHDYKTVEGQLHYLTYELENHYAQVLRFLREDITNDEGGAYKAGYYWCYNFEIPRFREFCSIERGKASMHTYWEKYKDSQTLSGDTIENIFTYDSDTDSDKPTNIDEQLLPRLGDVNRDNKIDMLDITDMQKIIAELKSFDIFGDISFINSDADLDGEITLSDVVYIQKRIANIAIR